MFRSGDNLKDTNSSLPELPVQGEGIRLSYRKIDKLITALYMVTDILEKDEPLRNKLRTLGADIVSDIRLAFSETPQKIDTLVSFLEIASTMNTISEMNAAILKKEFHELRKAVDEVLGDRYLSQEPLNIEEFLKEETTYLNRASLAARKGYGERGSLGIQKGSTLLQSIKDMNNEPSSVAKRKPKENSSRGEPMSDTLKKQRREDIVNIIKIVGGSATIKDIKDRSANIPSLNSCSEKTIQRELSALVENSVLKKEGSKRWSRYSLKS